MTNSQAEVEDAQLRADLARFTVELARRLDRFEADLVAAWSAICDLEDLALPDVRERLDRLEGKRR